MNLAGRKQRALIGAAAVAAALGVAAPAQAAIVNIGGWKFDVTSAPAGKEHYQAAYSAEHNRLWVTATNHRFPDGLGPTALESSVTRLNADTLANLGQIIPRQLDVGTPNYRSEAAYGLEIDDTTNTVWTTSTREGSVVVYDQDTGNVVRRITGIAHGRDIAIDPIRKVAFVSDPINRQITRINTETYAATTVSNIGPAGAQFSPMSLDLVYNANSAFLYTVNLDNGDLLEIDTINFSTRRVAQTGGTRASGVAVDRTRNRAFVSSQGSKDIRTFDLTSGALLHTEVAPADLLNSAVDSDHALVASAIFGGNGIFFTNAETGAKIGEIKVGAKPNDVIYANDTFYAVDRSADGTGGTSKVWRIKPLGPTTDPDSEQVDPGPSGPEAVATVVGTPTIGGAILLRGTNWRNEAGTAGSTIAVKLDDGRIVKPGGSDVWQTIQACTDGTFEALIQLPDGTAATSTPAFTTGAHSLRLLTGIASGDTTRTQSYPITVAAAGAGGAFTGVPAACGTGGGGGGGSTGGGGGGGGGSATTPATTEETAAVTDPAPTAAPVDVAAPSTSSQPGGVATLKRTKATTVRVGANRRFTVPGLRITCPAGDSGACTVRVGAKLNGKAIPSATYEVGAGKGTAVQLRLNANQLAALRKSGSARAVVTLRVGNGAGTKTWRVTVTLKAPAGT